MIRLLAMIPLIVIVVVFFYLWARTLAENTRESKNVFHNPVAPDFDKQPVSEHQKVLMKIARDEHELGLLPHNDSWVADVCMVCQSEAEREQELQDARDAHEFNMHIIGSSERMDVEAKRKAEIAKLLANNQDYIILRNGDGDEEILTEHEKQERFWGIS